MPLIRQALPILSVTVLLAQALPANAQDGGEGDARGAQEKNLQIAPLPVLFYTPETHWAYGAAVQFIMRGPGASLESRPSSLLAAFIYTQKSQMITDLEADLYLADETYHLNSYIGFRRFPFKVYGIGNAVREDDEEDYTPRITQAMLTLERRVGRSVWAGFKLDYSQRSFSEVEPGGMLDSGVLPGYRAGALTGAGVVLKMDSRDSIFYPRSGAFHTLGVTSYNRLLGGDHAYTSLLLDARRYLTLGDRSSLALQGYLTAKGGDPPFFALAQLGGNTLMRGYFEGQYRDRNLLVLQAEYRTHLLGRIGAVAFAGAGRVAPEFQDLLEDGLKTAVGLGLRFQLIPEEGVNLRFDFGFGSDSSGMYITMGEAF